MRRNIQVLFFAAILMFSVSCGDSGTDSEEPVPHDFTTAPSEELSQIIQETPSDFTWEYFNDNIQVSMIPGSDWSGEIVISGFQVQDGDLGNEMTSEAVQTNIDELATGVSTEELFSGSSWFPGLEWVPGSDWIPSTNWIPGPRWAPSEIEDVAMSQTELDEGQTLIVVYAHVPLETVEREQVSQPFGIIFQQKPATSTEKIAFTSLRDGNTEIYTMDTDGSNQQRLTNNSVVDYAPVISNDGSKIAFYSGRGSESTLHIMDLNGQNVTEITTGVGDPGAISWSPDDSQIVFSSYEDASREVIKVNVSDGSRTLLTDNSDDDGFPSWSPDGDEIVFVSDRNGGDFELFTMDTDGNNVQQITTSVSLDGYAPHPRWSPDGTRILIDGENGTINTMDPDGSNVEEVTGTSDLDNYPAWSADGTEVVFSRNDNIYKINADGSGSATPLTNTSDQDFQPYWSPVE